MAAYRPKPDAPAAFGRSTVEGDPTLFDFVRHVSVLAVTVAGNAGELVAVPGAFLSVDVADAAVASRRAGPAVPAAARLATSAWSSV